QVGQTEDGQVAMQSSHGSSPSRYLWMYRRDPAANCTEIRSGSKRSVHMGTVREVDSRLGTDGHPAAAGVRARHAGVDVLDPDRAGGRAVAGPELGAVGRVDALEVDPAPEGGHGEPPDAVGVSGPDVQRHRRPGRRAVADRQLRAV